MKNVNFGIIGMGNQGSFYTSLFLDGKIKDAKLIAVCDNNENRYNSAKEKYGDKISYYFSNYVDMLDSGICDVVMVVTPHYEHPSIVIDCLKRDVNVICDKPAGVYVKQVREMNEVAKKSKAKFAMMFNQRTNCLYRKMKELISSGEIGTLQRVTWLITDWFRTQKYYDSGSWRATWKGEGGGVLINQCPHQIDLLQWVLGEMPVKVNGFCHYGKWHDIEVEDDVTAYLEFGSGATGVFITTTGEAPGNNRFEVTGSKGKLICENNELVLYKNDRDTIEVCKTSDRGFDTPSYQRTVVETDGQNPQHAGIISNFVNALLGKEDLFVNGVEGINGVELMNAIELSGWRDGKAVTLPINDEEYLVELNARRAKSNYDDKKDASNTSAVIEDMQNTFAGTPKK